MLAGRSDDAAAVCRLWNCSAQVRSPKSLHPWCFTAITGTLPACGASTLEIAPVKDQLRSLDFNSTRGAGSAKLKVEFAIGQA